MPAPRFLYLHGFASGIHSKKAVAFDGHFAPRNVAFEILDLRVPSFEHLRLSAMLDVVTAAIGSDRDRAVIVGSSLGGLTAARTAERDPRVIGLVLLAPAFQLLARWRAQPGFDEWQRTGWHEVLDHTTGGQARVHYGFVEDAERIDVGFPDVRVPTLIFHGARDEVVPVEHARAFAAGKRHVRLVELDDGHELVASLPRILAESADFLAPYGA